MKILRRLIVYFFFFFSLPIFSTARLTYISRHGLIHSSLPLLIALTRERILESSFPAAAEALEKLYPAYRLDMDTIFKASVEVLEKHQQLQEQTYGHDPSQSSSQHNEQQNQLTRFYRKVLNLQPKNVSCAIHELLQ